MNVGLGASAEDPSEALCTQTTHRTSTMLARRALRQWAFPWAGRLASTSTTEAEAKSFDDIPCPKRVPFFGHALMFKGTVILLGGTLACDQALNNVELVIGKTEK
jgi:hypothetical protein